MMGLSHGSCGDEDDDDDGDDDGGGGDDDGDYFFECVIPRIGASQVLLCWFCITVAKGRKGLFEFLYGTLGMMRRMRIMIDDVRRYPLF